VLGSHAQGQGVALRDLRVAGQAHRERLVLRSQMPVDDRVGPERLDEVDDQAERARRIGRHVLWPDADRDRLAVLAGERDGKVEPDPARQVEEAPVLPRRAGSMFIAGEPMKPATNVVAGRV